MKLMALINFLTIPELSLKTFVPLGQLKTTKTIILIYYSVKTVFSHLILFHLLYLPLSTPNLHSPGFCLFKGLNFSIFISFSLLHYVSKQICIKSLSSWKYIYILKRKNKENFRRSRSFEMLRGHATIREPALEEGELICASCIFYRKKQ